MARGIHEPHANMFSFSILLIIPFLHRRRKSGEGGGAGFPPIIEGGGMGGQHTLCPPLQ